MRGTCTLLVFVCLVVVPGWGRIIKDEDEVESTGLEISGEAKEDLAVAASHKKHHESGGGKRLTFFIDIQVCFLTLPFSPYLHIVLMYFLCFFTTLSIGSNESFYKFPIQLEILILHSFTITLYLLNRNHVSNLIVIAALLIEHRKWQPHTTFELKVKNIENKLSLVAVKK